MSRLIPFIGLLLGGLFLWLAIRDTDFSDVGDRLADANYFYVLLIAILLCAFYALKARRWSLIFRSNNPPPVSAVAPSMMLGFAGNNVLPARLGELIRVYLAARDFDVGKSRIVGTLVVERLLDALAILSLLLAATFAFSLESGEIIAARNFLLTICALAIAFVFGVLFVTRLRAKDGNDKTRRTSLLQSVFDKIQRVQRGFAVLGRPQLLVRAMLNSIVQWILMAACIWLSVLAFGLSISPAIAVFVLVLIIAGITLPSAPGFVGTIEYCFILALGFFGVDATDALSIAIFYHLTTFLFVILSGLVFLHHYGLSISSLAAIAGRSKNKTR